jgi:histidinol-phosphatase
VTDSSKFLNVALNAIRAAEKITLDNYRRKPRVSLKADQTPVTTADIAAEKAILKVIQKAFPDHSFFGEESGRTGRKSDYLWIIDPIDGTKNFIAKIPLWGTLVALLHKGEVIVGVSNLPLLKEMLWAVRGKGAFLNGKKVKVSQKSELSQSMLSFGSLEAFRRNGWEKNILSLIYHTKRHRAFGDLWAYHLLAAGKLEVVIEASIKIMDVAPFDLIIREAGGLTSDMKGRKLHPKINSFVATNGKLHNKVLNYFK